MVRAWTDRTSEPGAQPVEEGAGNQGAGDRIRLERDGARYPALSPPSIPREGALRALGVSPSGLLPLRDNPFP
jgi:hypothetical protein